MALREKLEVIVDANVGGFVQGMDRAAMAADKGLGRTDDKLQVMAGRFTMWGAAAAGAGAVAAVGLGKMAMLAADAERQQAKLTNSISNSSSKFSANGQALRDQASALQKVTAAEDDAVVGAQSMLVQFGLTEDQVTQMTPLVVDLSRKMGIDLDAAAKAVGRSATGTTTALKRMGIDVDALGKGSTDAERTISALSKSVGGFAEAEGKTFAGQLEIIKNQLGEIGEGVGGGVLDIVKPLFGLSAGLSEVNPEIANTVGRVGTLTTAGITLAGGLTFATGQAIKMKDAFTTADGTLNKTGKTAAALGGILATLAISDALFTGLNESAGRAQEFEDAVNRVSIAVDKGNSTLNSFGQAVAAEQNTLRLQNLWQEFGEEIDLVGTGVKADVEQVQRAFDGLDPKTQKSVLDDLRKATAELPKNSDQYKANTNFINKNSESLRLQSVAARASGEDVSAAGDAAEESGQKISEFTSALEQSSALLSVSKAAAEGFASSLDQSTGPLNDQIDAAQGYASAFKEFKDVAGQLPDDLNLITAATGGYTDEQNKAIDALQGVGDAARNNLSTLIESGAGYDTVRAAASNYEQTLRTQLEQLGITGDAQEEYIQLLGLTPEQVETAVKLSGAEQARATLELLQEDFDNLPEEKRSRIFALIAQNDWEGALRIYREFRDKTVSIGVRVQQFGGATLPGSDGRVPIANGAIRMAEGGMLPKQALIMPAQSSPLVQWAEPETMGEAFIPLAPAKRNRSKDIWWETGKRLGILEMAAGGFSSDEPWGQYAEAMQNAWQLAFDDAPLKKQISLALQARDGYVKFSDEWVRFNRLLQDSKKDLAAQNADRADNQFDWMYDRSTVDNKIILAKQKQKGLVQWSDEWVRWAEELERLQVDAQAQLTPSARASGGRVSSGGSFTLQVNVNAQGLLTDPAEVGRQVVGAVKSYEQQNGTGWRS